MLLDQTLNLRPVTPANHPFLYTLYASTRAAEIALLPWNETQKSAFLQMQFTAQMAHYRQHFGRAVDSIIGLADTAVGRFYVNRSAAAIHLIDIALLPAYCNQGIGTRLLCDLLAEGASQQTPVQLQVLIGNPAQRLYQRLGFVSVGSAGIYQAMEWRPPR
jgi:ribosomal protein S18 acetylase RimI-like enzyme